MSQQTSTESVADGTALDALRGGLLTKIFSGQLRIADAEKVVRRAN
jgi:hypothetical protein